MAFRPIVPPNLNARDLAGRCLPYAQTVFGAPVRFDYAFQAWEATVHKHGTDEPLPNVPVLLWFSHWGRYYSHSKGVWEHVNAGHVTINVPGDGIYTSPGSGYGSEKWATISEIEQRFNAKYVGWSEDINGLRVAEPAADLQKVLEDQMANPIINVAPRNAVMIGRDDGTFEEYATPRAMNSRGIISVAFFGSDSGEKDLIPSLSEGDFQVVKTVWAQMCKGRAQTGGTGPGVSVSEIAKAVNDDAAERLKN